MPDLSNLFTLPKKDLSEEIFDTLFENKNFKLERIISKGQTTKAGHWYDQPQDEWVVLLRGNAKLLFENNEEVRMQSGDYIYIPAHKKHRVEWTSTEEICIWLALHFSI